MASHLVRVKSKLFVRSRRRIVHAVDGEYASRTRGRGFEFEDLREYQPGDNVRDIDWKATARKGDPLVRRYLTTLQRNVVILADTGTTMNAVTPAGENKADLAVLAAGMIGFLALRHGDRVGLVHGDRAGFHARPAREGERKLDALLTEAHDAMMSATAGPDLAGLVEHALPRMRRDAIVLVVTDDVEMDDRLEVAVRRLARANDTLWVGIADANPARVLAQQAVVDAAGRWRVPGHLERVRRLADEHDEHAAALRVRLADVLDDAHVSRCHVESESTVLRELLTMLQRRPYAR
ncbi:DUF58 domain-containing protein [Cellulomonas timonensis]|uniref:DUF58 domain-containing protein n=1 Tax=Cellulomonas timonensis TaxID=1689271 RepID=UPI0008361A11|nr:DUF58 domain-containing protein [Cellulomonas timonensis]